MTIPIYDWPEKDGLYKVVQIYVDGKALVWMAVNEKKCSHKEILISGLIRVGIEVENVESPRLNGKNYRVCGMGMAELQRKRKTATFSGRSLWYDIPIDESHLKSLQPQHRDWTFNVF